MFDRKFIFNKKVLEIELNYKKMTINIFKLKKKLEKN